MGVPSLALRPFVILPQLPHIPHIPHIPRTVLQITWTSRPEKLSDQVGDPGL